MVWPPPSNGLTIQLKPRRTTSRSGSASGFFALSIARSSAFSTARTSRSVQAAGAATARSMTSVVAKSFPLSQTSISRRIRQIVAPCPARAKEVRSPRQNCRQRVRRCDRRLADEVTADVRGRLPFPRRELLYERQKFHQRITMLRSHWHDDDKREVVRSECGEQRVIARAEARAYVCRVRYDNLPDPRMPCGDGGRDERHGARDFTEARPEARERLLEA